MQLAGGATELDDLATRGLFITGPPSEAKSSCGAANSAPRLAQGTQAGHGMARARLVAPQPGISLAVAVAGPCAPLGTHQGLGGTTYGASTSEPSGLWGRGGWRVWLNLASAQDSLTLAILHSQMLSTAQQEAESSLLAFLQ